MLVTALVPRSILLKAPPPLLSLTMAKTGYVFCKHAVAPAGAHELAAQETQSFVPAVALNVPGAHAAHVPTTTLSSCPAGQLAVASAT